MANNKNVSVIHSILTLYSKGWKKARIARELGIDVKTVRRYIRQAEDAEQESESADSKSPNPPTGSSGPDSKCEAYRDAIQKKVDSGLHAQRIFQDLVSEEGFEGGYDSVKRFVRKLKEADPERIYRMECLPVG